MYKESIEQHIKLYCARIGVKPTGAARQSGVGTSFISDINRGQIPSVAKVQQLAQYLGCTVSDLLGETKAADQPAGSQDMFMELYKNLPPDRQLKAYLELLNLRGKE